MKIYAREIQDGLEKAIGGNTSLAFERQVALVNDEQLIHKALSHFLAKGTNQNQIDLHYLKAILVTAGWNLNDDVFSVEGLWISRHTPEDKPFNLEHNEKDIIGHITSNFVIDAEGNEIPDTTEINSLPPVIQIVTNAVLYAHWSDAELEQRMAKIIASIVNGEYFVSMECLFNDFDYALTSLNDGTQKIVARNEQSCFLSKHLRAYGGKGQFDQFKVGRMLKNIVFSGKGLVKRPANPKSTIETIVPFGGAVANIHDISTENKQMSAEVDVKALAAERDALKAKLDELGEKQVQAKLDAAAKEVETYKVKAEDLNSKLATVQAAKDEMDDKQKATDKAKSELETKLADVSKAFDALKTEQLKASRVAALKDVGMPSDDAIAKVEKFLNVSDEVFAEVVALAKSNFDFMKKKKDEEDKDKADAGLLDTAKVVDDTDLSKAGAEPNEVEDKAVAAMSSWFKSVVQEKKS